VTKVEEYLLGYNAVWSVESQPTFRSNISPPYSGSKNEPICSSETSVDLQRTTRHYMPEDSSTLHNHCCENLISLTNVVFLYSREKFC
jgi:hypothetical protein